ncbi:hypothetical protein FHR83_007649 [Actinoplanes campanulatus]|uniref:Hemolysin-type calcium-binding repeat-containing protein n=1 Tax=Actinoplanes campanulatus TaxID=113559 RepID=A0A7W5AP95_9ACTN|nr:calcium-binding protein [Actinoplanes campanulatus]MBB3099933.1 hypothetical protein [Actinoplanes campanulatus]
MVVAGAVGVVATPAQAASTGVVSVYDGTKVRYKAGGGHQNRVLLSRSGNTITVDDRVAVKAGAGCKAVKGDRTKVRCTTKIAPTRVRVNTYDRNDTIVNNTGLSMTADGGTGSDKITGGPRGDILYADLGGDQIWGLGGNDRIYGSSQNDKLYGGDGADTVEDGHGRDLVRGGNGDDTLYGHGGKDVYYGDAGNDRITMLEYTDVADTDRIFGGAGSDTVMYSYNAAVNRTPTRSRTTGARARATTSPLTSRTSSAATATTGSSATPGRTSWKASAATTSSTVSAAMTCSTVARAPTRCTAAPATTG